MRLEDMWDRLLLPLSASILTGLFLFTLRALLLRWLAKQHAGGSAKLHFFALRSARVPSFFWCIALAIHTGIRYAQIPEGESHFAQDVIQVIVLFSVTLAVANYANRVLQHALGGISSPLAQNGLVRGIVQGLIYIVGILTILAKLGVRIEPLLTALGVGGLAVSLALQDTLGNMFAGINLLIDRAIVLGDRIQLDSGQQGVIQDIGWRTTKLKLDNEDLLVIPNLKLAQNIAIRKRQAVT